MSTESNEMLVKISSTGTISLPKQFRKHMDMQRGDYVKVIMSTDGLIIRKAMIT